MKALLISHAHPAYSIGGAQVASWNLFEGLGAQPGWNTHYLAGVGPPIVPHKATPLMSLGSVEAIKEMVRAGLGCAILPRMAVPARAEQHDLIVRSLSPKLYRRLAVVIRRDKRLDRGLRQTLSALKALSAKSS